MKLPSITVLAQGALDTFVRFPFVLAVAVIGTVAAIINPDHPRLIMTCVLGIPLLVSLEVFGERRNWQRSARMIAGIGGMLLLAGYYLTIPDRVNQEVYWNRFMVLVIALHCLVAFAPYLVRNQLNGFWQYNKSLFLRALATALYTGVLFAGLCLAMVAIEKLFGADIPGEAYEDLGFVMVGIFNTWFFLAGVPREFEALQEDRSYPNGLKVFTQYVLLPLVVIYLVILYLYAGKIVLEWEWPIGWVSSMIFGFSVAGILSLLLLYPIRDNEGNTWISRFYSLFYYALLPLTAVLFLAIWWRVSDYGITEERYYALALAVWLAAISVYMLLTRGNNIRAIPLSLAVLGFLSVFGPWGAFQVSAESQAAQLRQVLQGENLLENGVVARKLSGERPDAVTRINSIINYLDDRGRLDLVAPMFGVNADLVSSADLFEQVGATQSFYYNTRYFSIKEPDIMEVAGYERLLRYSAEDRDTASKRIMLGADRLDVSFNDSLGLLAVSRGTARLLSIDLNEYANRLAEEFPDGGRMVPSERALLEAAGNGIAVKLQLTNLSTTDPGNPETPLKISSLNGWLMIGRRNASADSSGPDAAPVAPRTPNLDTVVSAVKSGSR